jgi:hypothetical protein
LLSLVIIVAGLAGLLIVITLIASTIGLSWPFLGSRKASPEELAAKAELTKLGALLVMDADRAHVNSVNLSTLKSPDSIDRALALLPALVRIKSLNADGTQFRDEHADIVAKLDSLQDLVLSNTAVTDAAVEKLATLPALVTLYVVNTGVTSASMPAIARLQSLKILDISGTKITGDLAPLADLAELNWLLVRGLKLEPAALVAMADWPALSRLTLGDAQVPEDAVAELQRERPKIKIDR